MQRTRGQSTSECIHNPAQLDLQMRYKTNFGTFSETEIEHRRTHIIGKQNIPHTDV